MVCALYLDALDSDVVCLGTLDVVCFIWVVRGVSSNLQFRAGMRERDRQRERESERERARERESVCVVVLEVYLGSL